MNHSSGINPSTTVVGLPQKEVWVFGMVDTSFKPVRGYMEIVDRRDAATLIPIIERHVAPGSIIYSDQWRAYAQLANNQNYLASK